MFGIPLFFFAVGIFAIYQYNRKEAVIHPPSVHIQDYNNSRQFLKVKSITSNNPYENNKRPLSNSERSDGEGSTNRVRFR